MFTLGDVADVLDGALDTGISIIDTLSKLSEIADEGNIDRDKCFDRLQINGSITEETDVNNNNNDAEESTSLNSLKNDVNYNSLAKVVDDNDRMHEIIDNDKNNTMEIVNKEISSVGMTTELTDTSSSIDIVEEGTSDRQIGFPTGETKNINNDDDEFILQSSTSYSESTISSSDLASTGERVVRRRQSGFGSARTRKNQNRRATFVLDQSSIQSSSVQGIPIIEALGDLCNVADNFLKDYTPEGEGESEVRLPNTPSTPEEFDFLINSKVSEILSSFQKLDSTVDLLKKKALRDNFEYMKDKEIEELFPSKYREMLFEKDTDTKVPSLTAKEDEGEPTFHENNDVVETESTLISTAPSSPKVRPGTYKLIIDDKNDLRSPPSSKVRPETYKLINNETKKRPDTYEVFNSQSDSTNSKLLESSNSSNSSSSSKTRPGIYKLLETRTDDFVNSSPPSKVRPGTYNLQESDSIDSNIQSTSKARPGTYKLNNNTHHSLTKTFSQDADSNDSVIPSELVTPDIPTSCFFKPPPESPRMKILHKDLLSSPRSRLPELQVFSIDVDFEPLQKDSQNNVDTGFNLSRERPGTYILTKSNENSPHSSPLNTRLSRANRPGTYSKGSDSLNRKNRGGTFTKRSHPEYHANENRTHQKSPANESDIDQFLQEDSDGGMSKRRGTYTKESRARSSSNSDVVNHIEELSNTNSSTDDGHFDRRNTYQKESPRSLSDASNIEQGTAIDCNNSNNSETVLSESNRGKTRNYFDRNARHGTYTKEEDGVSRLLNPSGHAYFDRHNRRGTYTKQHQHPQKSPVTSSSEEISFNRNTRPGTYVKKTSLESSDYLSVSSPSSPRGVTSSESDIQLVSPRRVSSASPKRTTSSEDDFQPTTTIRRNYFNRNVRPGTYVLSKTSAAGGGNSSSNSSSPLEGSPRGNRLSGGVDTSNSNSPIKSRASSELLLENNIDSVGEILTTAASRSRSLSANRKTFYSDHEPSALQSLLYKSKSLSNIRLLANADAAALLHETQLLDQSSRIATSHPNLLVHQDSDSKESEYSPNTTRKRSLGSSAFSKLGMLKKAMSVSLTKLTQLHAVQREISLSTDTLTGGSDTELTTSDDTSPIDADEDDKTLLTSPIDSPYKDTISAQTFSLINSCSDSSSTELNDTHFSSYTAAKDDVASSGGFTKTYSHRETLLFSAVDDMEYDGEMFIQSDESGAMVTNNESSTSDRNTTIPPESPSNQEVVVLRKKKGRSQTSSEISTYVLNSQKRGTFVIANSNSKPATQTDDEEVFIYNDDVDVEKNARTNNDDDEVFAYTNAMLNKYPSNQGVLSPEKIEDDRSGQTWSDYRTEDVGGEERTTSTGKLSSQQTVSPLRRQTTVDKNNKPRLEMRNTATTSQQKEQLSLPKSSLKGSTTGGLTSKTPKGQHIHRNFLRRKSKGYDPTRKSEAGNIQGIDFEFALKSTVIRFNRFD